MSDFTQQLDEMKDCTVVTNDYLEKVNKALDELKRVRAVNAKLLEALKVGSDFIAVHQNAIKYRMYTNDLDEDELGDLLRMMDDVIEAAEGAS